MLRNDFALENDALTAVLISGPAHGSLTLAANGEFVYTPNANYNGTDKFIYKARSASGAESLATEVYLNLNPVNDAPVGTSQSVTTLEGTPIVLDLLAAFQDVDGDALSLRIINQPGLGTLTAITTGSDAGKWLYTPKAKISGRDTIVLRAWDGKAWSKTIQFTVQIASVNDAPEFVHDVYRVAPNTRTLIDLDAGIQDADGDCVNIVSFQQPQHGTVTKDRYGNYYYKPATGYQGADSFQITLSDGQVSTTATVSVQVGTTNASAATVTFEAQQSSQTTVSKPPSSSYILVNSSTAATLEENHETATIDWSGGVEFMQLQAPVNMLSNESVVQEPSLAEQTGLIISL